MHDSMKLSRNDPRWRRSFVRLAADYGMLGVLLALAAFFSWATWDEQHPTGAAAAKAVAERLMESSRAGADGFGILAVAGQTDSDAAFVAALQQALQGSPIRILNAVNGQPADVRRALESLDASGQRLAAIATTESASRWTVFQDVRARHPCAIDAQVVVPPSYGWPNFLKRDNLLNVANQIAVIAIVAIGMTLVIISGGIDLSVGSLIAFSAVVTTLSIRDHFGGETASVWGMVLSSTAGIGSCALLGLFSGLMVTRFAIPPFIVTLGMMLVGSGVAFIVSKGQSIYQVPEGFIWLGRGVGPLSIPNAVYLMAVLYACAHMVMSQMTLGRHIYAVGGNPEAARLSGVPVKRVLLIVYAVSGALAGLGGVITASQLKSGAPTYGQLYELYVIAAVVVGGASLSGGEGKVLGTLIGAFIIAVIQNGMNLTGVESYTQKVVLGLVILGAVLVDKLKHRRLNG